MSETEHKNNVLNRLRNLCSKAEKCPKDIRDKLTQWKYEGEVDTIIATLQEENFINMERYATAFINDKIKFSKWGKNKVRYNLKVKGINEETINSCLNSFSNSKYLEIVQSEVAKKNRSLKEDDDLKRKQKLIAFGSQRGYEIDDLYKILDKII